MTSDVIKLLFAVQRELSYPEFIVPVEEQIVGTSFFPGGTGIYHEFGQISPPAAPVGRVMVVGRDFDTRRNHAEVVRSRRGEDLDGPTWKNLRKILGDAELNLSSCFFTNAFMGLRDDPLSDNKNTGSARGHSEPFLTVCRQFFLRQIDLLQPRLIICLGDLVPYFVAGCSDAPDIWNTGTLTAIYAADPGPVLNQLKFAGSSCNSCAAVALTHPSMYGANTAKRRYRDRSGNVHTGAHAELQALREAIDAAGGLEILNSIQ